MTTQMDQDLHDEKNRVDDDTLSQIRERLSWTPAERLRYLKDMLAFERRARQARRA